MKKIFKSLLAVTCVLAISATSLALSACGKGNEEEEQQETGSKVFINTPITADAAYVQDCDQKGTIVSHTYTAEAYAIEEAHSLEAGTVELEKTLYVYKPYGYDETKKYDVLYLQHGGGENEGYWFAQGDYAANKDSVTTYGKIGNKVQNILDNLIKDGKIDPMLVVCGTYYSSHEKDYGYGTEDYHMDGSRAGLFTSNFYKELKNVILPLVQQNYSTYAESATPEGFTAARDHFGYIGFSLGSMTGYTTIWNHSVDYFSYIANLSGHIKDTLDGSVTEEDIINKLTVGEFKDYKINYWYNGCGEYDGMAITGHKQLFNAFLTGFGSKLQEGDDISKGDNCYFNTHKEGGHEFWCWEADLYNCLQVYFKVK